MKKLLLILSLIVVMIGCKKEPDYPIYTMEEKRKIYREAKANDNQEKIKELKSLKNKLEILGKKGDKTAFEEYADWDAVLKGL